jgi:hypothetical protein
MRRHSFHPTELRSPGTLVWRNSCVEGALPQSCGARDQPISHGDAGVSLYDVMQDGMGVLLDASTEEKASKLVAATTQRIRCVAVDTGPSMLIRPDTCVAWAGEENSIDGLEETLRRWFLPTLDDGSMVRPEH